MFTECGRGAVEPRSGCLSTLLGLARTMECMGRIQVNRELPDANRLTLSLGRARSQLHGGTTVQSMAV